MSTNTLVGLRVTFSPDEKSHPVTSSHVRDSIGKIQNQLSLGATAGQFKVPCDHGHQSEIVEHAVKVKWTVEGDIEVP